MNPIILDEFGAELIPRSPEIKEWQGDFLGKHLCNARNGVASSVFVAIHSKSHNALVCAGCHLRIVVSNDILPLPITDEVFEPLRKKLAEIIERRKAMMAKINNIDYEPKWAPASVFDDN